MSDVETGMAHDSARDGRRVLLVDDDPVQRRVLGDILATEGFAPQPAADGRAALRLLSRADYGVAIVDLRLPDIAGSTLVRQIVDGHPDVRVVINTGHGSFDSAKSAINDGAFAYVEKGGDPGVLIGHVQRAWSSYLDRYAARLEREVGERTRQLEAANEDLRRQVADRIAAESALRSSEQRLRTLIESAPFCIHEFDLEGRVVEMNPAGLAMLGKSSIEEVRGLLPIDSVAAGDREAYGTCLARARDGEVCRLQFEFGSDGAYRTFLTTFAPLTSRSGRVIGVMGHTEDVTDRIRDEQRRAALEEQLRHAQKIEAIGTLSAGVAHDFNNVLTAIVGHGDLALRDARSSSVRAAIEGILTAAEQAREMTSALMAFSRTASTERRRVALSEIVRGSLSMFRRMLPSAIEIDGDVADHGPWVMADPGRMHQVLLNLLLNARDAMPDGGRLTIRVGRDDPARARLVVEDTGVGIPEDLLPRVFDPFFTTKARGRGTGLGLSIVHGIVAEENGEISIDSVPGEGTRVTISLPRVEPVSEPDRPAPSAESEDPGGRILVSEDNPEVRRVVERALSGAGYDVVSTGDGLAAMRAFAEQGSALALAVMDVDLPGQNGKACVAQMQTERPGFPCLIISGYPTVDHEHGDALAHLAKPFTMRELVAAVRELLRRVAPRQPG